MKIRYLPALLLFSFLAFAADDVKPQDATAAVIRAFDDHDVVMFGEIHANKQEYEWLRSRVSTPGFAERVDDIVMEFGNSLYQKSVDRYVSGEDVPVEQVQKAWRNLVGAVGPPSPVYVSLYQAVRQANIKRRGKHQMRILCADPYIDWDKVKDREDIGPYLSHREDWYTEVVKEEVVAKHHRALLISGAGHFIRHNGSSSIEQQLKQAGANTFLIVFGTNTVGPDQVDHRFDAWPAPAIIALADTWVAELPALPVTSGGGGANVRLGPTSAPTSARPLKLKDAADALLYLGPADSLTQVFMASQRTRGQSLRKRTRTPADH